MDETPNRKKCPNCGTMNFLSSETCLQCGAVLPVVENKPPDQQMPVTTIPPAPTPPSAYPPPTSSSDTTIYIILGFIFAGLGLFCCGIPAIAGLVMGIIASSKGNKLGVWVIVASSVILMLMVVLIVIGFLGGHQGHGVNPFMPSSPHYINPSPNSAPKAY